MAQSDIKHCVEICKHLYCSHANSHLQADRLYKITHVGVHVSASRILRLCDAECFVIIGSTEREAGPIQMAPRRSTSTFGHVRPTNGNYRHKEYKHITHEPGSPVREYACCCNHYRVKQSLHNALICSA